MKEKNCFRKKFIALSKCSHAVVLIMASLLFLASPAMATIKFALGNIPGKLMGYANQSITFGIAGDEFDTKKDFQSSLFQLLLEAQLDLNPDLRFFGSIGMNADWAYPILSSNDEWDDKDFDDAYDELFIYSHWQDILHEAHVTWTPGDWYFRIGKQIVVWGETDGFRLMDQINPLDQRRGLTDVEFETAILPIWLVRTEYYLHPETSWLTDLGFEFIFNPSAHFRGDESIVPGNDRSGIWAPGIEIPLGGPYPFDKAHLGSFDRLLRKPENFGSDGFEYGLRIKSVMWDSIVSLNAFYGRDNSPVTRIRPLPPRIEISPDDGRMIFHLPSEGFYPLMRFVGFTFTRDFEKLYIRALGGIAPVLRVEAFYAFENTYTTTINTFKKYDEVRYAIGIDWRVRIRRLNPRDAFGIYPQFFHRKIMDYPHGYQVTDHNGAMLRNDNFMTSLMITTTYFHNKIIPSVFWLRDITEKANFFKIQVAYERSDVWNYTLGVLLLNGAKTGDGFQPLTNKDQVYFTMAYRF